MSKLLKSIGILCFISVIYLACKHEIPLPIGGIPGGGTIPPPAPVTPCSPDTVYFQNTILPLVVSSCAMSGCHDAISHKEGLNLTTYAGIMKIVNPGNPTRSSLYTIITTTNLGNVMPPPPYPRLSTTQADLIKKWIQQGAANNGCTAACDTTAFTYSGTIKQIMASKCNGCHSGASASAGIDLTTYNGVKTVATNGRLMGSIQYKTGFVGMPVGSRLPDCEVTQIQKWITAGTLNN